VPVLVLALLVARRLAKEGYKVVIASRNPDVESAEKEDLLAKWLGYTSLAQPLQVVICRPLHFLELSS
jgi:NAD(P)-dependent dehydrogenase (short-subunit alcohol dehydrogenase family)